MSAPIERRGDDMRIATWKRLLAGLGALCLVGVGASQAQAVCGDANNNGRVGPTPGQPGDPGDSILLLQLLGGVLTPGQTAALCGGGGPLACLDENSDGAVNSGDLV